MKLDQPEWRLRYETYNKKFETWDTVITYNNPESIIRATAAALEQDSEARSVVVETRDDDGWRPA